MNSNLSQWRQCSCTTLSDMQRLQDKLPIEHIDDNNVYIFLTHSCSISINDFIKEPKAEYIIGTIITQSDKQYVGRKNPRKLHLKIFDNNNECDCEINISQRGFIDRHLLEDVLPSEKYVIPENSKEILIRWIVQRYNAPAFSDVFNNRFKHLKEKIEKIIIEPLITGVYIYFYDMNDSIDLDEGEDYYFELLLTTPSDITDEQFKKLEDIQISIKEIGNQKYEGIFLEDVSLLRESEVTLQDIRIRKLLLFDYLSERKKPGGLQPIQS